MLALAVAGLLTLVVIGGFVLWVKAFDLGYAAGRRAEQRAILAEIERIRRAA